MIAVVERVTRARVTVDGQAVGAIDKGLLLLLGVGRDDDVSDLDYIVRKTANLRIFPENGKMSKSVKDIGGAVLVVSQFTLLGDTRKGNRPDFGGAAQAEQARRLYEACIEAFRAEGIHTESGEFGAHMNVESCGDGPVTILLNSKRSF
jgi:D-tyrosyl-tRNA(Tyr) deacylase